MAQSSLNTSNKQSLIQDSSDDDEQDENNYGKPVSCDTMRKKIKLFLATKEMTQTAFLSAIGGVNSNSFGRFMKLKGSFSGSDNGTYWGARKFFDRREKKRKANMKATKSQKKVKRESTSSKRLLPNSEENLSDDTQPSASKIVAHDVELPNDLPVFDDCDEVRTKIAKCIHEKKMSQAGFSKAIGMTTAAVSRFLAKKGHNQGAGSDVYYNAYRYFEKERLRNGEPKSSHRLKSEKNYPQGFSLTNPPTHVWVFTGKK